MKRKQILMVLAATLVFCISEARAQDQQQGNDSQSTNPTAPISPLPPQSANDGNPQAPQPAGRGLFISDNSQDQGSGQVEPDSTPLSGAETPGLGSLNGLPHLFDLSLNFVELVESGLSSSLDSATSIGGSLLVARNLGRSRLALQYSGAGSFYSPNSSFNTSYHYFDVSERMQWKRWGLLLRDDFVFSPQAAFGGLYTGTAGQVGQPIALPPTTPTLTSGDTILTGNANRLTDTAIAEVDYSLSGRATLTFTGSYGVLHFLEPGYQDSDQIGGIVGYNYVLDAKNSLALSYIYGHTDFNGSPSLFQTQLVQISYGRKITGRLAFHIAGGPELLQLQNYGSSSGEHGSWSLGSSLQYQLSHAAGFSLSYFHGTTAGSGVFLGAVSDTITGGAGYQLTRFWSASVSSGYARSSNLVSAGQSAQVYDNLYVGGSLGRPIGRQIHININYGFQKQFSGAGTCPVLSCGLAAGSQEVGSVSIGWHPFTIQSR